MTTTTWARKLGPALKENGETWADVEAHTFKPGELDQDFDDGYGCVEGCAFTLWTSKFVYFPVVYDGSEWVGCVSRHPDNKPTSHIGEQ